MWAFKRHKQAAVRSVVATIIAFLNIPLHPVTMATSCTPRWLVHTAPPLPLHCHTHVFPPVFCSFSAWTRQIVEKKPGPPATTWTCCCNITVRPSRHSGCRFRSLRPTNLRPSTTPLSPSWAYGPTPWTVDNMALARNPAVSNILSLVLWLTKYKFEINKYKYRFIYKTMPDVLSYTMYMEWISSLTLDNFCGPGS